jgi:hypothetical protein
MAACTNQENIVNLNCLRYCCYMVPFTVLKICWDLCKNNVACNQKYLFQFTNPQNTILSLNTCLPLVNSNSSDIPGTLSLYT